MLISNIYNHPDFLKQNLSFILLSHLNDEIKGLYKIGFIKIPKKLVPRNLNLLVKTYKKSLN